MAHGPQHVVLELDRPGDQQRRVRLLERHGGLVLLRVGGLGGGRGGAHGARELGERDGVEVVVDGGGAPVDGEGRVELEGRLERQVAGEQVQAGAGAGSQRGEREEGGRRRAYREEPTGECGQGAGFGGRVGTGGVGRAGNFASRRQRISVSGWSIREINVANWCGSIGGARDGRREDYDWSRR